MIWDNVIHVPQELQTATHATLSFALYVMTVTFYKTTPAMFVRQGLQDVIFVILIHVLIAIMVTFWKMLHVIPVLQDFQSLFHAILPRPFHVLVDILLITGCVVFVIQDSLNA